MSRSTSDATQRSDSFVAGDMSTAARGSFVSMWRSSATAIVSRTVIDENSRGILERTTQAEQGPFVRERFGDVRAAEDHPTVRRDHEPGDEVEDRRLPGAVRTDQPEDLALVHREADAVDRLDAAERDGDVGGLEGHPVVGAAMLAVGDERGLLPLGDRRHRGRSVGRRRLRSLEEHRPQHVGPGEQLGRRAVEADLALLHEDGALGEAHGDVDGLLDEDDRRPLRVDVPHDVEELLDDHRCQAEGELVDHQQLRLGDERLAEREHLLLAAREVARLLRPPSLEDGEVLEHLLGRSLDVLGILAEQPAGEVEVLLDGQGREDALAAGHEDDPLGRRLVRVGERDVVAVVDDGAGARLGEAGDGVEERRLPGAVGAEKRHDLALVDLEVDVEQHLRLSVRHVEAAAR